MRRSFLALACAALAVATTSGFRHNGAYAHVRKSSFTSPLRLTIGLKRRNADALAAELFAVSDPDSPRYGRHLSQQQVLELTAPAEEDVERVLAWLERAGIEREGVEAAPGAEYLHVTTTVGVAEALLSTEYHSFASLVDPSITVNRVAAYSLPEDVAPLLDFVAPTVHFPPVHRLKRHAPAAATGAHLRSGSAAVTGVTPDVIRSMYGVGNDAGKATNNTAQAAGFLGEFASAKDLNLFYKSFFPAGEGHEVTFIGPNQQSGEGLEASLDVQYLASVSLVNTTYWYTNGSRPYDNEPFLEWLTALAALPDDKLPRTVSVSYGDQEYQIDPTYGANVNTAFAALGARGVSIMFSSGDAGVGGSQPGACPNSAFVPTFPAASPYVTAVGATDQPSNEIAASFSAGGFSNYWKRPAYQTDAVAGYFKVARNLPPASAYNATGAGFPDVAAIGTNFNIVCQGSATQVDGTSCSAPTFAGMVSLLNDHRLAAGKSPLGYLNLLIYKNPQLFKRITTGNNPGCNSQGFYCADSWSPVTGMGSLNYPAALKYVMSLP